MCNINYPNLVLLSNPKVEYYLELQKNLENTFGKKDLTKKLIQFAIYSSKKLDIKLPRQVIRRKKCLLYWYQHNFNKIKHLISDFLQEF